MEQPSDIVRFYMDEPNPSKYTWTQVIGWDDKEWDSRHDFIQWIFPTDEISKFNKGAPCLTVADVKAFYPLPKAVYYAGLERARSNHELSLRFDISISKAQAFLKVGVYGVVKPAWWANDDNHNVLRISRIIRSIALIYGQYEATQFMRAATNVFPSIGKESLKFWTDNTSVSINNGEQDDRQKHQS